MVRIWEQLIQWIDSDAKSESNRDPMRPQVVRVLPFIMVHLACLSVFWVGWSWIAVSIAFLLYVVRMFAITAFYHRYFSHRSFKTHRLTQFIFALLGGTATQRGALWWAAHHRHHHKQSDRQGDSHSPVQDGFWWSHCLWFTCDAHFPTDYDRVRDFSRYKELVFLNRFDLLIPFTFAILLFAFGWTLNFFFPGLGTSGWQMVVWGYFISTVFLAHATFTINSLAHKWGTRPYDTPDQSRNNFFLAILTLGEGWHNNHHRFPSSSRQGLEWWQLDMTFIGLKLLSSLGIIWDLKPAPVRRTP